MDVCVTIAPEWGDNQHTRLSRPERHKLFCAIHNLKHLKPKNSVAHIRGLLSNAKRVGDQCVERDQKLFDEALKAWKAHEAEHKTNLKTVADKRAAAKTKTEVT